MCLEIFPADFVVFRGISQKYLNFAGPRPREISDALFMTLDPQSLQICQKEFPSTVYTYSYNNPKAH